MSRKMRVAAMALAIIMLLFAFTAAVSVLHKHSGGCAGEDCPICEFLSCCEKIIAAFIFALILFAILPEHINPLSFYSNRKIISYVTPVSLRVKMTN